MDNTEFRAVNQLYKARVENVRVSHRFYSTDWLKSGINTEHSKLCKSTYESVFEWKQEGIEGRCVVAVNHPLLVVIGRV